MSLKSLRFLNLVMAIIYTVILVLIAVAAIGNSEGDTFVGAIILSGSVVANWITWSRLKKVCVVEAPKEMEYVTTNE